MAGWWSCSSNPTARGFRSLYGYKSLACPGRLASSPAAISRASSFSSAPSLASSTSQASSRTTPSMYELQNGNGNGNGNGTASGKPLPKFNSWVGIKGPGSLDLRSDVMTVPTPSMLAAVQACSLRDDVFNEDPTTQDLEAHVARLTGKEAGLFVLSGTMGNQIALRSLLTQPPHSVLADHRCHIINYEAGGVSALTGASVHPVVPKDGIHLTLEDVKAHVVLSSDIHACPTRVISLENTLNGMVMPLAEASRISAFARANGIKMHCDGARLWEAVASGAGTLPQYCALFDTVSLCFSKGLGAPVGSMIVGDATTLQHARHTRKMIGGGMRQPGLLTAAARVAVDETFGLRDDGSAGLLRLTHEFAKKVERVWIDMGGALVHPVHTNIVWLDVEAAGCSLERFGELCKDEGLTVAGNRLVTHYQIAQNGDEVLPRLERAFAKVMAKQ